MNVDETLKALKLMVRVDEIHEVAESVFNLTEEATCNHSAIMVRKKQEVMKAICYLVAKENEDPEELYENVTILGFVEEDVWTRYSRKTRLREDRDSVIENNKRPRNC